jgi:hypothetical protein
MKKTLLATLALPFVFISCAPPEEVQEEKPAHTQQEFSALLKDKKQFIESLYAAINSAMLMADTATVTDTFLVSEAGLGFYPLLGTHTNAAIPDSTFNAVMVSSYAAGLPLPEGMKSDWFRSDVFVDLTDLKNGKPMSSLVMNDTDPRLWSSSFTFITALQQLRYIVVVHPVKFSAGQLSATNDTFDPADMEAVLMIYDLQEKRICGARKIYAEGPQSISYSYEAASSENGWKDKSDDAAAYKFEKENQDTLVGNTFRALESQFKVRR